MTTELTEVEEDWINHYKKPFRKTELNALYQLANNGEFTS